MAAQSAETVVKLNLWRQKIRDGSMTQEEYKEVIKELRGDRMRMTAPTAGSKVTKARKAAAAKPNGDDLLSELE